jgi:hypothetical protein
MSFFAKPVPTFAGHAVELHAFAALYQDLHRLGSIHSILRARSAI